MEDHIDMKAYIKSLEIDRKASADEITTNFKRILTWLSEVVTPHRTLTSEHVQLILYAAAILHAYLRICDSNIHADSTFHTEEHLVEVMNAFEKNSPLVYYSRRILETSNAVEHIPVIQYYFKMYLDENQFNETIQGKDLSVSPDFSKTFIFADDDEKSEHKLRKQTMPLVNRIFQLRNEDIAIAISRLIDHLPFENVARILLEENKTGMYKKCLIIQNEICKRLDAVTISEEFLVSLFKFSSTNAIGLSVFYKCMRNEMFATALKSCFLGYLKEIENFDEENARFRILDERYRVFKFEQISFLIGAMLSVKSPIRMEMYQEMYASITERNLIEFINQRKFIYDY